MDAVSSDGRLKEVIEAGISDFTLKNSHSYANHNHNYGLTHLILPKTKYVARARENHDKFLRDLNMAILHPAGIRWSTSKTENIGSSGLHLSASELAQLMRSLFRSDVIIDNQTRTQMRNIQMGGRRNTDELGAGFGKGGYPSSHKPADTTPAVLSDSGAHFF